MSTDPEDNLTTSRLSRLCSIDCDELKTVDPEQFKLFEVKEECTVSEFVSASECPNYRLGLGYGFYEFTKKELIGFHKKIILMGKV